MTKQDLRIEAVRLRAVERHTVNEIAEILGVAKGTVYYWVGHLPLSKEEKDHRRQKFIESGVFKKPRAAPSKFAHLMDKLTRHQKCKLAEAAILYRLVLFGFEIFEPISPWNVADFLVRLPAGNVVRIQVKWTRRGPSGLPMIPLTKLLGRRSLQRYKENELDIIVGYDAYSDRAYVYTRDEIKNLKRTVTVKEENLEKWEKIAAIAQR